MPGEQPRQVGTARVVMSAQPYGSSSSCHSSWLSSWAFVSVISPRYGRAREQGQEHQRRAAGCASPRPGRRGRGDRGGPRRPGRRRVPHRLAAQPVGTRRRAEGDGREAREGGVVGARGPKPRDPAERFAEKVRCDRATGCWVWQSQLSNVGYGLFYAGTGKVVSAHRWQFERWNGAVPEGLQLDHLRRNRACANPWHLEAVTRSENCLRGLRGRLSGSQVPEAIRERNRARQARHRARKKAAI